MSAAVASRGSAASAMDDRTARLRGLTVLPVLTARDAVRARLAPLMPDPAGVAPGAVEAAIDWLCLTHEVTGRRGSSKGFSLAFGWYPAFPETTGYVIGTLLAQARRAGWEEGRTRAIEMGDWELEIQSADGGIVEGILDGRPRRSEVFNTGMVLHGWLDLGEALGGGAYLDAAERAGRFIVAAQDSDGAWRGEHSYKGLPHVYCARVAWALARLADATGEPGFERGARRHLDWVLGMQRDNGWFDACVFKSGTDPNTHALAYTLRGLLESHVLLEDERYLEAALLTSEVLIRKLEVLGAPLPATFDSAWRPTASYACLTGMVQLGGVWLRLYQLTGDARLLNAGLKAVDATAAHQQRGDWAPVKGALPGSFPVYGRYAPLQCPNWATKFMADALMLRADCLPSA